MVTIIVIKKSHKNYVVGGGDYIVTYNKDTKYCLIYENTGGNKKIGFFIFSFVVEAYIHYYWKS